MNLLANYQMLLLKIHSSGSAFELIDFIAVKESAIAALGDKNYILPGPPIVTSQ
jgi:hypothetical protein